MATMLTSAIFPEDVPAQQALSAYPLRAPGGGGFTLLELLLVMAVMALMTGLVAPRLGAMYDSFHWALERDDVLRQLGGIGARAQAEGREYILGRLPDDKNPAPPLQLPAGWRLEASPPIRYWESGVCGGGRLLLLARDRELEIFLRPPLCSPAR